jgi:hypothetical protein
MSVQTVFQSYSPANLVTFQLILSHSVANIFLVGQKKPARGRYWPPNMFLMLLSVSLLIVQFQKLSSVGHVYCLCVVADMHLMYDHANGNGWKAMHLCQVMFPHCHHPNHKPFATIYRQLRGTGTFDPFAVNWGRERNPSRHLTLTSMSWTMLKKIQVSAWDK